MLWMNILFALGLPAFIPPSFCLAIDPEQVTIQDDLKGFDVSRAQAGLNPNFWTCAFNAGYEKVAIRAYFQACARGGAIDSNFVPAYQAATNAGFTNIDAYMFPCVGDQPTGVPCKAPEDQIQELVDTINSNNMNIQTLWFDIEPTRAPPQPCNAWQLGHDANMALAKQWVTVLGTTGRNWGIYGNRGQWTEMFGSVSADVASDLPLWAAQNDKIPGVGSARTFGGWTSASAKQYFFDTKLPECGGSLDLDSFSV